MLQPAQQRTLLEVARRSIDYGLDHGRSPSLEPEDFHEDLRQVRASFVTLNLDGRLRGCIGSLEAREALVLDVNRHAYASAFSDPRFPPLDRKEAPRLHVHISVLSPHSPIRFASEAELLGELRPGVDGLVVEGGGRRATFLPSVWGSLPEPADFLAHLKKKAGLAAREPVARAWRYTAESISA